MTKPKNLPALLGSTAPLRRNSVALSDEVVRVSLDALKPFPGHAREHDEHQLKKLIKSIGRIGLTKPIIIDESNTILCGHACVVALARLGQGDAPTLTLSGLTEAEKRALVLADNRIAEDASWDLGRLKIEIEALANLDLDLSLTGFSTGEIDLLLAGPDGDGKDDDVAFPSPSEVAVTRPADLWILGEHRLFCGDARSAAAYEALLGSEKAQMVLTDAPFNVGIQNHARGRCQTPHREFAMASGEMSDAEFSAFLEQVIGHAIAFSGDGSIHYWFMDWRHLPHLLGPALKLYSEWKNLLVWHKSAAGMGTFYRSQHELIPVFKSGNGPHINNFGLGAEGRNRSNVLVYPSADSDTSRREVLAMHPTVKPAELIADLMRDCSHRCGLVLDPFGGSGTALLAAEKTGRKARVIEIDALYCDLSVRRWQKKTGKKAVHEESGRAFDAMAEEASHG